MRAARRLAVVAARGEAGGERRDRAHARRRARDARRRAALAAEIARGERKHAEDAERAGRTATNEPGTGACVFEGRRIALYGAFDSRRHVLLRMRVRDERPGVAVVTPLVLAGDSLRLLVQRGWLPSDDGVFARPQDFPEREPRWVSGVIEPLVRSSAAGWHALESDSLRLWSSRSLDPDSIARALPDVVPDLVLRELPGPGVPDAPRREPPARLDENEHLSYALQWFSFAAILVLGTIAVLVREARAAPRPDSAAR